MILLTGGTGFVGQRVVAELCQRGERVRCLVRKTSPLQLLHPFPVEFCYGDVTDPPSLPPAVAGVKGIIHLAAIIRERGRATFDRVNYQGTVNLLKATRAAGVERFLYMSNIGVSPDPAFPFLYSKWRAEEAVKQSGLGYTIFRSSVMFGPGDGFVRVLADLVRRTPLVPVIGNGQTQFQLIAVEEVARCLALAIADETFSGRTVEVGGAEHLSYEQIIDLVIATSGKRRLKLHIPVPLMRPIVWTMERVLANPPVTGHQLKMLAKDNITDIEAVERTFGFKPTPLSQGISYVKQG